MNRLCSLQRWLTAKQPLLQKRAMFFLNNKSKTDNVDMVGVSDASLADDLGEGVATVEKLGWVEREMKYKDQRKVFEVEYLVNNRVTLVVTMLEKGFVVVAIGFDGVVENAVVMMIVDLAMVERKGIVAAMMRTGFDFVVIDNTRVAENEDMKNDWPWWEI
ncbi:hypothetical protein RIF29_04528 [Crotalaria pallida]|uniref:Uncharacterized protein n=1 Tax=Crotalaria pallida TaxID=3830 RepID=A0AAN9J140_CROPI